MQLNAASQSVYSQYSDVYQKLKSGDITAEEALDFHGETYAKARGFTANPVWTAAEATPIQSLPPELMEMFEAVKSLLPPLPSAVTNAYSSAETMGGSSRDASFGQMTAQQIIKRNFTDRPTAEELADFTAQIFEQTLRNMDAFSSSIPAMEAAGVTPDDLSRALVTRTRDGTYKVAGSDEKASNIARFINDNPGVYEQYNNKWKSNFAGIS
jgi:hypothetical protein